MGALTDPPPLARETAGAGTQRAKAGTGWLPLPAALRALWPRRVPSPGLTRDPGVLQTGGPDSRKTGDRGPRGRLPVPRAGARRVQGRVSVFFYWNDLEKTAKAPGVREPECRGIRGRQATNPEPGPDKLGLRIGRTGRHPQLAQAPCKSVNPDLLAPEGAILARGGPLQAPAENGPGHSQARGQGRRPPRSARLS